MTISIVLAAIASGPKPFRVVTTYASGAIKSLDCHSAEAAENHAFGERRKIGKVLIDRLTNLPVRVVSVSVEPKQA